MAKKNNDRFELNKGGSRKFDLEKGTGKHRFDLSKDDELIDEENVGAGVQPGEPVEGDGSVKPVIPVEGVNPPQPEVPASVLEPDLSEEATDKAIEFGPEEPKKKGFAWLWALIGIAIVLAFLGWTFLKKGDKTDANAPEQTEEAVAVVDSANDDSIAALPSEGTSDEAVASVAGNSDNGAENGAEGGSAVENSVAPSASTSGSDVETEAMKVIRGEYGNNPVRRNNLGSKYQEIQNRVNELKRTGKF
ncbi:MAG: hypothetical protein K2J87_00240 [Muribaculaceae bacterium]|nr:hypothetical protein [Muribaculaceae bacterium]